MLTIHQLEVFVVVAEEMSVRKAAERLTVSQPAVSASLAALQRELGAELIRRNGRGIELTDSGVTMLRYASILLGLVDEAISATRATHAQVRRPVRIGATSSLVTHVLAPILTRLRELQDDLDFSLEVGNRTQIWRQLDAHEIDLAMSSQPPTTGTFTSLATMPNSFVVVARPGTVWAGHLSAATWLIREQGSTSRAVTDEVMTRLGVEPRVLVIGTDEAILASVEAGLGVGLLPTDVVEDALRARSLVTVRTEATPLSQPWHLVVRTADDLEPPTRRFVRDLVEADPRFTWTPAGHARVT